MQGKIDLKSLLLGVALGGALLACYGAAANSIAPVGRFAIEANPAHAFVLDTVTGQVWQSYMSPNGGEETPGFSNEKLTRPKAP